MSVPSAELLHVAGLMRDALQTCILPYFGKLSADQIGQKGPEDFVTIADTSAETFLGEHLLRFHPGSRIIGEEGTAADPALLTTLNDGACWIIDPVDGTWLFKNNQTRFGTLISRSQDGVTKAGWVLETYLDETGTLQNRIIMGDAASGVWHSPTDGAIFERLPHFSAYHWPEKPEGHLWPTDFKPGLIREDFAQSEKAFAWTNELYSSVSMYNMILRGLYAASFSSGSMPWDHSAGNFLVQLLGGTARHLISDQSYQPDSTGKGIGIAVNTEVYANALADVFKPRDEWPTADPDIRK